MSEPDMVVHIFDPSTQTTELGRSLYVQGQCGLYTEFSARQGYTVGLS